MDTTKQELEILITEVADTTRDAVTSGTWIYPVYGIVYLGSHPSLYRAVAPVVGKCILVSLGITAGLFVFTWLPQLAFCALFSGPLAFLPATIMVLGEAYFLSSLVARNFFIGPAQDQIFDAVLLQQGNESLVSRGREVKSTSSGMKLLGKSITKPLNRFSKDGIVRYIISIPLNSIPVVGTFLFLLWNGKKSGPGYHSRYFQLKGYSKEASSKFVASRRGAYTAFGAVSLALQLVPFVGMAFSITSTVGAALWANALEKGSRNAQKTEETDVKID
ncbi:hypothetical protein AAF712_012081 [Marasmius tenuissimus]|uniref:Outer spore wall protein RRT8 n=1 Tax=Marasmius tenuissimus TaxID=585030 RepID=A0ABR2ZIN0_9AGAR|nr:hypothetical protein PM082_012690 [Marasmius tenuissimus]